MKPLRIDNYKAARAAGLFRVFGDADRVRNVSAILEQDLMIHDLRNVAFACHAQLGHEHESIQRFRLLYPTQLFIIHTGNFDMGINPSEARA